jgi:transcriptional regulator
MQIKDAFRRDAVADAQALVAEHPFATVVTRDLTATHMPCLLDEDAAGDELVVLGHVARADPAAASLDGPLLLIFHGPHGYVSASWYGEDTIPTWNHVTLHVRGTPELLDDALPLLRRTVDHFEARVPDPWSLDRMPDTARAMADEVIGFRLRAASWHVEAKLSQDKPSAERRHVLEGLERSGAYRNPALAAAMRRAQRPGFEPGSSGGSLRL